jgi:hypothetical protein
VLTELHSLNDRWLRAWFEKDVGTVERMMADDYEYVAPHGQVMGRQAVLGIIRSPSYQLLHGTCTEVVVRLLGDGAAVIRKRWQGEGTFEGTSFKDDHSLVMVWVRLGSEWQIVMEQCTANSR